MSLLLVALLTAQVGDWTVMSRGPDKVFFIAPQYLDRRGDELKIPTRVLLRNPRIDPETGRHGLYYTATATVNCKEKSVQFSPSVYYDVSDMVSGVTPGSKKMVPKHPDTASYQLVYVLCGGDVNKSPAASSRKA